MVEFKTTMNKSELQEIAAANGIPTDDMTKQQIIDALNAHNAAQGGTEGGGASGADKDTDPAEKPAEGAQGGADGGGASGTGEDTTPAEKPAEGAQGGADGGGASETGKDTTPAEKPAEDAQKAPAGYHAFVYAGPSLPRGRLKEHVVVRGTFEDVKAYLADVLEDYPQVARLIVPVEKLATFSVKVKTPGNIAHKHYNDIVSAMRGAREV